MGLETEYSGLTEIAAEIFETYGPVAASYAMLYRHCVEQLEMPPRVAEHYVCTIIDLMKE